MNRTEGLALVRTYQTLLRERGVPVEKVVYGSIARNAAHADNDIDIAVICRPFTRRTWNSAAHGVRWMSASLRIVCIRKISGVVSSLAREVERTGIPVT